MKESVFQVESPDESLGFLLWKITVTWQREVRRELRGLRLTHPQFVIMAMLAWAAEHSARLNQVSIARESRLDKMTVSKSLAQLDRRRLVRRHADRDDPRANMVELTEAGRDLAGKAVVLVEKVDRRFFDALSGSQRRQLGGLFLELLKKS